MKTLRQKLTAFVLLPLALAAAVYIWVVRPLMNTQDCCPPVAKTHSHAAAAPPH
jgi:hypothetical protein